MASETIDDGVYLLPEPSVFTIDEIPVWIAPEQQIVLVADSIDEILATESAMLRLDSSGNSELQENTVSITLEHDFLADHPNTASTVTIWRQADGSLRCLLQSDTPNEKEHLIVDVTGTDEGGVSAYAVSGSLLRGKDEQSVTQAVFWAEKSIKAAAEELSDRLTTREVEELITVYDEAYSTGVLEFEDGQAVLAPVEDMALPLDGNILEKAAIWVEDQGDGLSFMIDGYLDGKSSFVKVLLSQTTGLRISGSPSLLAAIPGVEVNDERFGHIHVMRAVKDFLSVSAEMQKQIYFENLKGDVLTSVMLHLMNDAENNVAQVLNSDTYTRVSMQTMLPGGIVFDKVNVHVDTKPDVTEVSLTGNIMFGTGIEQNVQFHFYNDGRFYVSGGLIAWITGDYSVPSDKRFLSGNIAIASLHVLQDYIRALDDMNNHVMSMIGVREVAVAA